MSGGSRNKTPLVGNTGGALPCVRVINHPAPGGAGKREVCSDGYQGLVRKNQTSKQVNSNDNGTS